VAAGRDAPAHKGDFTARVDKAFKTDPILFTSEAVRAVFELLTDNITTGAIEDVRHAGRTSERFRRLPSQVA
jgi:uncharacterized protein (DUF2267 family)